MESTFSIKGAIKFGWQTTMANKGFLIGMLALMFLVSCVFGIMSSFIQPAVDFSPAQFEGNRTPEILVQALTNKQISLPAESNAILSLNRLLERPDLYKEMKIQPFDVRESISELQSGHALSTDKIKVLNRKLLEANFPTETPPGLKIGQKISLLVISFFSWMLNMLLTIGMIKISLRFYDQEKPNMSELFTHWRILPRLVAVYILVSLAVMLGFILLIIPGIILAVRLQFASYLAIDKNTGIVESLKESLIITKGQVFKLMLLGCVLVLINLGGLICLFIGLLFSVPITILANVFVYRQLVSNFEVKTDLPSVA